jgi:hypothetical protein
LCAKISTFRGGVPDRGDIGRTIARGEKEIGHEVPSVRLPSIVPAGNCNNVVRAGSCSRRECSRMCQGCVPSGLRRSTRRCCRAAHISRHLYASDAVLIPCTDPDLADQKPRFHNAGRRGAADGQQYRPSTGLLRARITRRPPTLAQAGKPYLHTDIRRPRRPRRFGCNDWRDARTTPARSYPHRTAHTRSLIHYSPIRFLHRARFS